jgi:predicted Zn-dependent protease
MNTEKKIMFRANKSFYGNLIEKIEVIKETPSQVIIFEYGKERRQMKKTDYAEICPTFDYAKAVLQAVLKKDLEKAKRNLEYTEEYCRNSQKQLDALNEGDLK